MGTTCALEGREKNETRANVNVHAIEPNQGHLAKQRHLTAFENIRAASTLARALAAHAATRCLTEARAGTATDTRFLRGDARQRNTSITFPDEKIETTVPSYSETNATTHLGTRAGIVGQFRERHWILGRRANRRGGESRDQVRCARRRQCTRSSQHQAQHSHKFYGRDVPRRIVQRATVVDEQFARHACAPRDYAQRDVRHRDDSDSMMMIGGSARHPTKGNLLLKIATGFAIADRARRRSGPAGSSTMPTNLDHRVALRIDFSDTLICLPRRRRRYRRLLPRLQRLLKKLRPRTSDT